MTEKDSDAFITNLFLVNSNKYTNDFFHIYFLLSTQFKLVTLNFNQFRKRNKI